MSSIIKTYIIYIYRNLITGKYVYVGQTSTSLKRRAGKNGIGYRKTYFEPEIQKYGWNNFQGEILTTTTDPEYANLLEWFYTIEFNTLFPNGCNDKIGSQVSEREKNQISKKLKGRISPFKGKKHSEEWKKQFIERMTGHDVSEETRRKIGEKAKLRPSNVSGTKWFTNGIESKRCLECPEGFWPGRSPKNKKQNNPC